MVIISLLSAGLEFFSLEIYIFIVYIISILSNDQNIKNKNIKFHINVSNYQFRNIHTYIIIYT